MNIKQLEAFVRIVKNKSFSQTAKELYLTQPTVSSYISSLEEDLGVQLFNRTTKEVHTTNEGEQIYLYAKDIVNLSNKIRNAFKDEEKEEVNEIIISASSIPAQYLLPGILANFSKRKADFVMRENGSGTKKEAINLLTQMGLKPEELKVVARFANTGAILLSVKEGIGVAIVSRLAARNAIKNKELLDFPLQEDGYFRKIYLVSNNHYPMSNRVKLFLQMMQNHVEKQKIL